MPDVPLKGERQSIVARGKIWIELDGPTKKGLCCLVFLRSEFVEVPKSPLVGLPGIEPFRRFAQYSLLLGISERWLDDPSHACRDLVLHGKDIVDVAVVAFGPDMSAGGCIDQLRGNAHPITALAH